MNLYETTQSKNYFSSLTDKREAEKLLTSAQDLLVTCYQSFKSRSEKCIETDIEYRAEIARRDRLEKDTDSVVEKIS